MISNLFDANLRFGGQSELMIFYETPDSSDALAVSAPAWKIQAGVKK